MNRTKFVTLALLLSFQVIRAGGKDYHVRGRITSLDGLPVSGAVVSMTASTLEFRSVSRRDGTYTLNISGIYSEISELLENGMPFPNPSTDQICIPFIISKPGDIRFSVYSLQGKKIYEKVFPSVDAGSYNIIWDGSGGNVPVSGGVYIYALGFQGRTYSGRLIKAGGSNYSANGTTLEQVAMNFMPDIGTSAVSVKVITEVKSEGFHTVRLTDITIRQDTLIDFNLSNKSSLPFKTESNHIAMLTPSGYRKLVLKGINLGSSPPGTFPGEIAYAINSENYEKWIKRIAEAGFNSIRVYTLHPPVFYEKLANYNYRHPDRPLLLFQGIWLDEIENPKLFEEYDLMLRLPKFKINIREVLDCIHGNNKIDFRPGRAYGDYLTDVSGWTAGFILGREISPFEIERTNLSHTNPGSFKGSQFSISNASPSELFLTMILDEASGYESISYKVNRPVSISSWPTLDPLVHPTEIYTDEDKASTDINKINHESSPSGIFATYHAYPYYPNFVSNQPEYQAYSDNYGRNSYYGYIKDLKAHYRDIPLIIGEFGVPSSWGNAHQAFSGMSHGGHSELQQGVNNLRMMQNLLDAGCGGGFMFSWMDEWFKETWITNYLEAYGFVAGTGFVPTRQIWHNIISPEQNFGLIGFIQESLPPFISQTLENPSVNVKKIETTHDNEFFYVNINFEQNLRKGDTAMIAFDTYSGTTGESLLPNGKSIINRAEFLLAYVTGEDTARFMVTEAYDMKGLTPRFDLADHDVQKFRSIVSDRGRWNLMNWINDEYERTSQDIGLLPVENSEYFSPGSRCAIAWSGSRLKIRMPWTMMYFYDPTQKLVVNGAESVEGGLFRIIPEESDGIALSVYLRNTITSTKTRYSWEKWLVVPATTTKEKKSLQVVEAGLSLFPDFAE